MDEVAWEAALNKMTNLQTLTVKVNEARPSAEVLKKTFEEIVAARKAVLDQAPKAESEIEQ